MAGERGGSPRLASLHGLLAARALAEILQSLIALALLAQILQSLSHALATGKHHST